MLALWVELTVFCEKVTFLNSIVMPDPRLDADTGSDGEEGDGSQQAGEEDDDED